MTTGATGNDNQNDPTVNLKNALIEEIAIIQRNGHFGANIQFAQATLWRSCGLFLNVSIAFLSAISGGMALSKSGSLKLAGSMALIASTLSAIQAVLNTAQRALIARNSGNSLLEIRNSARQLLSIDIHQSSLRKCREDLRTLLQRLDEIHRNSDPPSRMAMAIGRKHARETLAALTNNPF